MKYAYISMLVPMPEGETNIPAAWTDGLPDGARIAAFTLNAREDLDQYAKAAASSIERSNAQDGWPK